MDLIQLWGEKLLWELNRNPKIGPLTDPKLCLFFQPKVQIMDQYSQYFLRYQSSSHFIDFWLLYIKYSHFTVFVQSLSHLNDSVKKHSPQTKFLLQIAVQVDKALQIYNINTNYCLLSRVQVITRYYYSYGHSTFPSFVLCHANNAGIYLVAKSRFQSTL